MAINDPVGDLITRIRNAQMRRHSTMSAPVSKLRGWVLDVLQDEGYIRGYARIEKDGEKRKLAGKEVDGRAMYGQLKNHLRWLMIEFHTLPFHADVLTRKSAALDSPEDVKRIKSYGVKKHIPKPIDVEKLLKEMDIPFSVLRLPDYNALRQLSIDEECVSRSNQKSNA